MTELHLPKVETFDTATSVNTDPKGFLRAVDRWNALGDVDGRALYMARPADHPRFGYLESWLIPDLDLRVNRFHFRNKTGHGHYPDQDLYIDIALVEPPTARDDHIWRTTDLYIDVVTYRLGEWEILDLEELGDALVAGYLSPTLTSRALAAAQNVVTGIVTHGSIEKFLKEQGYSLLWADQDSVQLAPPIPGPK